VKRIRVLHLIDGLGPGGAQSYLLQLIRSNPHRDLTAEVACLHGGGPYAALFERSGIPVHSLSPARWNPVYLPRLRALLRSGDFDLVHAHLVVSGFVCEIFHAWLGRPILIEHLHSPVLTHVGSGYQRLLERAMFRRASRYIACSHDVAASLKRFRPGISSRIATLPSGVSLEELDEERIGRAQARRELGLTENDFVIGSAGRLNPLKNYPLLLRAGALLKDHIERLKIVIFGAGSEEASLRRLALRLGMEPIVLLPGYDPDAAKKLGLFDVFVLTSDYEGLPMVLMEALAAGVACITTDFASASEVIHDGRDGLIVPRSDADCLAASIRKLWGDSQTRQTLGAQGRLTVRDHFSIQRHWEGLRNVYEEALGAR
jgi:L-malate glycosyltransferase